MRDSGGSPGTVQEGARWFTTTQWNLIVEAGDSQSPHSREALETLCQTYWPPVYSYIQRRGYDREAALDLTQGFFTQLLSWRSVGGVTSPGIVTLASNLLIGVSRSIPVSSKANRAASAVTVFEHEPMMNAESSVTSSPKTFTWAISSPSTTAKATPGRWNRAASLERYPSSRSMRSGETSPCEGEVTNTETSKENRIVVRIIIGHQRNQWTRLA